MQSVRCSLCRQQVPTLKLLISHYIISHSKLKIVKELLKFNSLRIVPNLLKYKNKTKKWHKKQKKSARINPKIPKTETLYLNENIHILCGQNELIIGDDSKSNIDAEFSFTQIKKASKENCMPIKDKNDNITKKKVKFNNKHTKVNKNRNNSPSASSEDSLDNSKLAKKKVKHKKQIISKLRHYRINITKLKNQQSLDECTGEFYICHCREEYKNGHRMIQRNNIRIVTSDTDSCSDTGKHSGGTLTQNTVYCNKCGNGYNTSSELADHMQIHESFCRLCNEQFINELVFKEHMRLHIFKVYMCHVCGREFPFKDLLQIHFECHVEDRTFETVLDMEEDYIMHRYNFTNLNYNSSINSILRYLGENQDIFYYSYKFMKVVCELCFNEIFIGDYEQHLQNVHFCGF